MSVNTIKKYSPLVGWGTVIIILPIILYRATPALQYAEGWRTFYYDSDYYDVMLSSYGAMGCIKAFFLQFFAHPWHGTAVMTLVMMLYMAIIDLILTRLLKKKLMASIISAVICIASAVSLTSWMGNINPKYLIDIGDNGAKSSLMYMRMSNYVRHHQWDEIIDLCNENGRITNLLHQNSLNMALAEKEQLGDKLLDQPVEDINSIYVSQIQTAEVAGLLSDVYFSFGHIAQSQRYAFETNEKMFNLSPRMLQRLIETNLIFGQKEVAEKYQLILSKTLYYKDWKPSEKEIAEKRKCIFDDNRFSGIKGLDDDLLHIARNTRGTRQCRVTLQYLGSLYILARYDTLFVKMADEFSGSKDLAKPMPEYFEGYYKHLLNEK